jgi:hypothetical protein
VEKKEKVSFQRRAFLIAVGMMVLFLDKLEGKATAPRPVTSGRIEIVK